MTIQCVKRYDNVEARGLEHLLFNRSSKIKDQSCRCQPRRFHRRLLSRDDIGITAEIVHVIALVKRSIYKGLTKKLCQMPTSSTNFQDSYDTFPRPYCGSDKFNEMPDEAVEDWTSERWTLINLVRDITGE